MQAERDQLRYGQKASVAQLVVAGRYPTVTATPPPVAALNLVPNFIGLSKDEALRRLPERGFVRGNVVEVDSGVPPGTVIDQDPKPRTLVPSGTRVNLVVVKVPPLR